MGYKVLYVFKGPKSFMEKERLESRGPLKEETFIRLEKNTHVVPFDDSEKPRVYLPSDFGSSFPTVKKEHCGKCGK